MPGQHELCQPFLDRHKHERGWDVLRARDDLMNEVPLDEIGRAFGPVGILQVMHQMTCKSAKQKGKPRPEQYSFAFDYFGVDPGHVDPEGQTTLETDAMSEGEFELAIRRCDEQITADIDANKKRKAMLDELRPIFRAHPEIQTIGEAIEILIDKGGTAAA
jgi:hypothetical protein